jgi:hypothetical protein
MCQPLLLIRDGSIPDILLATSFLGMPRGANDLLELPTTSIEGSHVNQLDPFPVLHTRRFVFDFQRVHSVKCIVALIKGIKID